MKERLRGFGVWLFGMLAVAAAASEAVTPPVVAVAREPAQRVLYGMDFERLWYWDRLSAESKKRVAEAAVKDCRVQYVRVAVRGAAEPEEGVFKPEAYDQILEMMTLLKTARPDIRFFGSPRPINAEDGGAPRVLPYTGYPLWITRFQSPAERTDGKTRWKFLGFEPEKAADYLVRYVRFMKSKGFAITYLDLKNEAGKLTSPADAKIMSPRIRAQLGSECPLLLAPSGYDYGSTAGWVEGGLAESGSDYMDILATHNTEDKGSLENLVALGRKLGKPVWNTELHGWHGPDDAAATNMAALFYQVRSGVSGMNEWLSLGSEGKPFKMFCAMKDGSLEIMRVYYIYRQLVNTSGDGQYVPTTIPEGLRSTVAFVRGKQMTVWLLNAGNAPQTGVRVELGGRTIAENRIRTMGWGPENGRQGSEDGFSVQAGADHFVCDVAARTLVCYTFEIK